MDKILPVPATPVIKPVREREKDPQRRRPKKKGDPRDHSSGDQRENGRPVSGTKRIGGKGKIDIHI